MADGSSTPSESLGLRYGRGEIRLRIPGDRLAGFHAPPHLPEGAGGLSDPLHPALERCDPALDEFVSGRRIALFLSDGTREEPRAGILEAIGPALASAGNVLPVIATGSHDPAAPGTLAVAAQVERALAEGGVRASPPLVHDPFRGPFRDLGRTVRGTPVLLNAGALDWERLVVVSDMKPHYFAGYSCPPKFLFPGVASLESIEANHAWTLDPSSSAGRHPWHPEETRRGNPLAEDYCEAFEIALGGRPAFALTFGSSGGRILWAEAGELRAAAARGMVQVDQASGVRCPPSRYAVISPGGWPNDVDLYIGQRALELTGAALADGGEVLFLCRCLEGVGPSHSLPAFWDPLGGDRSALAAGPTGPYRLYSHKAVRFARLILRLAALHLHSDLAAAEVAARGIRPAADPQAVVDHWLERDPSCRIRLFDGANKLSVIRDKSP